MAYETALAELPESLPAAPGAAATRVDLVFFDAGSGHRSAARALEKALAAERPHWRIRCLDLPDILQHNRSFHWIVARGIRWLNEEMQRERVFDLRGKVNLSLLFSDLLSKRGFAEIARFWAEEPPHAIVSVTPMYNAALHRAARLLQPDVKYVTVPVDFEQFKKRYWFTPKSPQQLYLNGSERLHAQARALGIPDELNVRIAGMPADPSLYDEPTIDIAAERRALGLDPNAPTLVVHFGGQGSTILVDIARSLSAVQGPLNAIFLCGKSEKVADAVRALETPYRKAVLGYTPQTPIHYLRLADVVIGKPGTLTITEGLLARRPLVLLEAKGMGPVQRGNEDWVREHGVGLVAKNAAAVPEAVTRVLGEASFREAADRHHHRGVFDAARTIARYVERGRALPDALPAPA